MTTYSNSIQHLSSNAANVSNNYTKNRWDITQRENQETEELMKKVADTLAGFSPILNDARQKWIEAEKLKGQELFNQANINLVHLRDLQEKLKDSERSHTELEHIIQNWETNQTDFEFELTDDEIAYIEQSHLYRAELAQDLRNSSPHALTTFTQGKLEEFKDTFAEKVTHYLNNSTEKIPIDGVELTVKDLMTEPGAPLAYYRVAWQMARDAVFAGSSLDAYSPELLAHHGVIATPPGNGQNGSLGTVEQHMHDFLTHHRRNRITTFANSNKANAIIAWDNSSFTTKQFDENNNLIISGYSDEARIEFGENIQNYFVQLSNLNLGPDGTPLGHEGAWNMIVADIAERSVTGDDHIIHRFAEAIIPDKMLPPKLRGKGLTFGQHWHSRLIQMYEASENLKTANVTADTQTNSTINQENTTEFITDVNSGQGVLSEDQELTLTRIASTTPNDQGIKGVTASAVDINRSLLTRDYFLDRQKILETKIVLSDGTVKYMYDPEEAKYLHIKVWEEYHEDLVGEGDIYTGAGLENITTLTTQLGEVLQERDKDITRSVRYGLSLDKIKESYKKLVTENLQNGLPEDVAHDNAKNVITDDLKKYGQGSEYVITPTEQRAIEAARAKLIVAPLIDATNTRDLVEDASNVSMLDFLPLRGMPKDILPGSNDYLHDAFAAKASGKPIPEHVWEYYRVIGLDSNLSVPQIISKQMQAWLIFQQEEGRFPKNQPVYGLNYPEGFEGYDVPIPSPKQEYLKETVDIESDNVESKPEEEEGLTINPVENISEVETKNTSEVETEKETETETTYNNIPFSYEEEAEYWIKSENVDNLKTYFPTLPVITKLLLGKGPASNNTLALYALKDIEYKLTSGTPASVWNQTSTLQPYLNLNSN